MKKITLTLALLLSASAVGAQTNVCTNPTQTQSAIINFSSATTTSLVAPAASGSGVAATRVVVCGFSFTMVGAATANTFKLEYGTGSTCGTGTVVMTGTYTASVTVGSSTVVSFSTPFATTANQRLCGVTTTADSVQGTLVYVLTP